MSELKACPFCGSGARFEPHEWDAAWQVICNDPKECDACVTGPTQAEAARIWNTRPAPTEGEVEALAVHLMREEWGDEWADRWETLPDEDKYGWRVKAAEYLNAARAALGARGA